VISEQQVNKSGALLLTILPVALSCAGAQTTRAAAAQYWSLAVHGGAGGISDDLPRDKRPRVEITLKRALQAGQDILVTGGTSLDAVQTAIHILEDSGLFDAGRSPVYNHKGYAELDASIMSGRDRKAGAVAGVRHIANPIDLARLVMDESPHVLLVADGAEEFAREQGIKLVPASYFLTDWRARELKRAIDESLAPGRTRDSSFAFPSKGTVGAVALDVHGDLAAGTSTGGLTNKHVGRIGDSPIIGAGTYAQNGVCAVSATGHGEYFIRYHAASTICARIEFRGESVDTAASAVIEQLRSAGGEGGVIAMDARGHVSMPFSSKKMLRGMVSSNGTIEVVTGDQSER
jgi:beta-aspartyl-peptidase (threonine type)